MKKILNILFIITLAAFHQMSQAQVNWHGGSTMINTGNTNSPVVNKPTDLAANNLLIVILNFKDKPASISPPSGFTLINSAAGASAGDDAAVYVYQKTAGASEPSTYTFTTTGVSTNWRAQATRVSGHLIASPIGVSSNNRSATDVTSLTMSVTTSQVRSLVVGALTIFDDYFPQPVNANASIVVSPATMTPILEIKGNPSIVTAFEQINNANTVTSRIWNWVTPRSVAGVFFEILVDDKDTDLDGVIDAADLDNDNDGIWDIYEAQRVVFEYTGADQTFVLPPNVVKVAAKIWGAGGRGDITFGRARGGAGGFTYFEIDPADLTSNTLTITVGQGGNTGTARTYGNGGAGRLQPAPGNRSSGAGGGMSAVSYVSLTNPASVTNADILAIAGGGGSSSSFTDFTVAGPGGGFAGGTSVAPAARNGLGGTQSSGGMGGLGASNNNGNQGSFLQGADAIPYLIGEGAGGGGYYGGGSGGFGGGQSESAGGGGSSYISPVARSVSFTERGSGFTPPFTSDFDYANSAGRGGFSGSNILGGNGRVVLYLYIDSDRDGVYNYLDTDSDNDGVPDGLEANPNLLASQINPNGTLVGGVDSNGVPLVANGGFFPLDTDGDGIPNFLDIDSDNDGIVDVIESQPTTGYIAPTGLDHDNDGIDNAFDPDFNPANSLTTSLIDTDGDGTPDIFDLDSDNDLLSDMLEAAQGVYSPADSDRDGLADVFDLNDIFTNPTTNSTNNGQLAANPFPILIGETEPNWRNRCNPAAAGFVDIDGDGVSDFCDLDNDNDGILDSIENSFVSLGFTLSAIETDLNVWSGSTIDMLYDEDYSAYWFYFDSSQPFTTEKDIVRVIFSGPTVVTSFAFLMEWSDSFLGNGMVYQVQGFNTATNSYDNLTPPLTSDGVAPDAMEFIDMSSNTTAYSLYRIRWLSGGQITNFTTSIREFVFNKDYRTNPISLVETDLDIYNGGTTASTYDGSFLSYEFYFNNTPTVPFTVEKDIFRIFFPAPTVVNSFGIILDYTNSFLGDGVVYQVDGFDASTNSFVNLSGPITSNGISENGMEYIDLSSNTTAYQSYRIRWLSGGFISWNTSIDEILINLESTSTYANTDFDAVPDYLDTDSDNDGIPDALEANHSLTPSQIDANGRLLGGVDANGVPLIANGGFTPVDTDGDGIPDYLDIDSDNDGIVDVIESQPTFAYVAPTGLDHDNDGIDNAFDVDFNAANSLITVLEDTDNDGTPDIYDLDSDGDGLTDEVEAAQGTYVASDADGDGLADVFDLIDLRSSPTTNSTNGGQTAINPFPTTDNPGGQPNWRNALCFKTPNNGAPTSFATVGISTHATINGNWPNDVPNAMLVLESLSKGFVITRITTAARDASSFVPVEGMLIYNTTVNRFQLRKSNAWVNLKRGCNE